MWLEMAQNKITELFEATLNSRDRRWDAESLAKVKAAWNCIDSGSEEFKEIAHLLDKEALDRAEIDTSLLPAVRDSRDFFDPATGCSRLGQAASLVECLSIPGHPYFGCVVHVGKKRVRCVARRKHTWQRDIDCFPGEWPPGASLRTDWKPQGEWLPRPPGLPPPDENTPEGHTQRGGGWWDKENERVDIAGACYVEQTTGGFSGFFSKGDLNAIRYEDFIAPDNAGWRVNHVPKIPHGFAPSIYCGQVSTGTGFRKPNDSPGFYFPDTLEYQMPWHICTPGFAICSPYLKVAVTGSSVIICLIAVTLYKEEHRFRKLPRKPYVPVHHRRERSDHGGWSCRLFGIHELL